jgi:hypothetical protein
VLDVMMEQDREALCGPKWRRDPARHAGRGGSTPGEVTLGGRRLAVRRPRVRSREGAELHLPSFAFEVPALPASTEYLRAGSIDEEDIPLALDVSDEEALAGDSGALLDRLDLLLTYGTLSAQSRATIRGALEDPFVDASIRVPLAIHLILISPDYAVID